VQTVSSRKSMPTGIGHRNRAVPVSRRRPMSDPNSSAVRAASAATYHREAGYLQPLIVSSTGAANCHTKYLELLNVPPTPASRHQLIGSMAAARMARAGGTSPALPARSQYSALVSDDSPGTSLLTGLERCWKDDADDSESTDETNSPRPRESASSRLGGSAPCGGYWTSMAERQPTATPLNDNRIYNVGLRLSSAGSSAASDRHQREDGNGSGMATVIGASQADISPLLPVRHRLSQLVRD